MRILIIGGTRFMGPYIIRNLHAAGHEVCVFHRGQTKTVLPEGVQEIQGNRNYLSEHAEPLRQFAPEIVLDMIILHEQHAHDLMATFADVAQRVVMISSQDVYQAFGRVNRQESGEIDTALITEDSPLREHLYPYRGTTLRADSDPQRWMDDYDKIPCEHVVMSHPTLPGTVLRLPAVYGPYDAQHRMFSYLKRMLDGRPAILLEEGLANWRWTHGYVENVADVIALTVTKPQTSGHIYNVGEPFALSTAERVEQIAKAADWHGRIVTVPPERLPENLRTGINTAQHIVVDTSRIQQDLDYHERIDVAEAFRRTIAWEKEYFSTKIDAGIFNYEVEDAILADL